MAEIDRSELVVMCFRSRPDFVLVSAVTSTNAGESESMTASQSEQTNEAVKTKINETIITIISRS